MVVTIGEIRREVAKHGGKVAPDGCGGYDLLAPEGYRWRDAEVWCQPLPLSEAESKEERDDMLRSALAMVQQGVEEC